MAIEIERKFLVRDSRWKIPGIPSVRIRQGYLPSEDLTVRVRLAGDKAFLTLKGRPEGIARSEFEYGIPVPDAEELLTSFAGDRCLEKIRYRLPAGEGLFWEIDEYSGGNAGLFTAEIELPSPDAPFERPDWLGREVTGDFRYSNSMLARHPWKEWTREERIR